MTFIRESRRWGDSEQWAAIAPAAAFDRLTAELVRIEPLAPGCWSLALIVTGVAAVDVPLVTFTARLSLGVGSFRTVVELPFAPNTLASIVWLPATALTVQLRGVTAGLAAGGSWQLTAWAAPMVPFDGLRVEPVQYREEGYG